MSGKPNLRDKTDDAYVDQLPLLGVGPNYPSAPPMSPAPVAPQTVQYVLARTFSDLNFYLNHFATAVRMVNDAQGQVFSDAATVLARRLDWAAQKQEKKWGQITDSQHLQKTKEMFLGDALCSMLRTFKSEDDFFVNPINRTADGYALAMQNKFAAIAAFENSAKSLLTDSEMKKFFKLIAVLIFAAVGFAAAVAIGTGIGMLCGAWTGPGAIFSAAMGALAAAKLYTVTVTPALAALVGGGVLGAGVCGITSAVTLFGKSRNQKAVDTLVDAAKLYVDPQGTMQTGPKRLKASA